MLTESPEFVRWRTEFKAEGKAEGEATGKVQAARELIQDTLAARFGGVPAAVCDAVTTEADMSRLKRLNYVAVTCADMAAFVAALQADAPAV